MVTFTYDYTFLFKTIKYIFLPILVAVIVAGFFVFLYSRKAKKTDIDKYNYIIDLWTTLLAIVVVAALFAVTLGFSISLTNTIKLYDLVNGHEIIYYLVLIVPVIPLIFLFIYLYKFIVTLINKPNKKKTEEVKQEEIKEEVPVEEDYDIDYHTDFSNINVDAEDNNTTDESEVLSENENAEENTQTNEEIINIDDLPDVFEESDDIEIL